MSKPRWATAEFAPAHWEMPTDHDQLLRLDLGSGIGSIGPAAQDARSNAGSASGNVKGVPWGE